jgi:hypothetical protein
MALNSGLRFHWSRLKVDAHRIRGGVHQPFTNVVYPKKRSPASVSWWGFQFGDRICSSSLDLVPKRSGTSGSSWLDAGRKTLGENIKRTVPSSDVLIA